MRRTLNFLSLGLVLGVASVAFAQDVPVVTNDEFLQDLFAAFGGTQGATGLAIALIVVKLIMKFIGTPWADKAFEKAGAWKLTIYTGLSAVSAALVVLAAGGTGMAAMIAGGVMTALGVFINQIYKQFFVKAT